eukprot:753954-Hanusia_phi.AAC.6
MTFAHGNHTVPTSRLPDTNQSTCLSLSESSSLLVEKVVPEVACLERKRLVSKHKVESEGFHDYLTSQIASSRVEHTAGWGRGGNFRGWSDPQYEGEGGQRVAVEVARGSLALREMVVVLRYFEGVG